ncbi:MAG: fumarate hydratase [Limnochordia bacterium]|nr:fumarate hydratase [Limnochordia bacterium]
MKEAVRDIHVGQIAQTVAELSIEANTRVGTDVIQALERAVGEEESPLGKRVLHQLLDNHRLAAQAGVPVCQDTGTAVVFLEIGQDVHLVGGDLTEAVNQGIAQGYLEGYLRKSMVSDPLIRENTSNNTPGILHTRIISGDRLRITVAPKGGGSENMSFLRMLPPSTNREELIGFVVEQVKTAGANPCPPIIVGVGIGGNFEYAAYLAKYALLRPVGTPNADPLYAQLELDLLREINKLGIGPQGFGGTVTALAVHVETYPCHITGMPVGININCHAARHASRVL